MTFCLEILRSFQTVSQRYLSTKENVFQEGAGFLMINRCLLQLPWQPLLLNSLEDARQRTLGRTGNTVTSVSIVDWEHGCFTVQLRYAVVCILKERAKVRNDKDCNRLSYRSGRKEHEGYEHWRENKNSKKASSHILKNLPGEHLSSKEHRFLISLCSLC